MNAGLWCLIGCYVFIAIGLFFWNLPNVRNRRICCVCGDDLGPWKGKGITHGYCDTCLAKEKATVTRRRNRRREI